MPLHAVVLFIFTLDYNILLSILMCLFLHDQSVTIVAFRHTIARAKDDTVLVPCNKHMRSWGQQCNDFAVTT
jgi:hypothetical protein